MDIDEVTDLARKHMGEMQSHPDRERGYVFHHGQRTAWLSLNLRRQILPEDDSGDDILYVSSLFHDVGKGAKDHAAVGAEKTEKILKGAYDDDDLHQIAEIVRQHNLRDGDGRPILVQIVQDADLLDHFGAMEIWLKFQHSARKNETVDDVLAFWNGEWFADFCSKSRAALNYKVSRELLDQRLQFHTLFKEQFIKEIHGEIDYFTGS